MERKVLGRGLDSLISTDGSKEKVQSLPVASITPSKFQPRLSFDETKIAELASSIREKGVVQPILVRAVDGGQSYELIAGERRWRAAKAAGLVEIPAIVRRIADSDVLEISIIENVQREELNAVDEAKAYRRLAQEFGLTQETIAQKVGKDKSSISNLLRILNLPESIQDLVCRNILSLGHAKALLALGDEKRQIDFCDQIVKKGLSVRQIEQLTAKRQSAKGRSPKTVDQDIAHLEGRLRNKLQTKVQIRHSKKRGIIEIDYYSLDDLERLLALIGA